MSRELEDLLPVLEPPPNGVAKLRAKLAVSDARERRRRWMLRGAFALVPATCVVVIAFFAYALHLAEDVPVDVLRSAENPALMRFGFQAAPDGPVTIVTRDRGEHAVLAVVDGAFYWIE